MTHIYVMKDTANGYYKLGQSIRPLDRERTLQSEKPTIELVKFFQATGDQEAVLHRRFAEQRIRGEWFNLSDSDLEWIDQHFQPSDPKKGLFTLVTTLCDFHRHIHSKTANFVYDSKRRSAVTARVKERRKAKLSDEENLGLGAQAIIGCRLSEWHQGMNDRSTVYDDIELIFRNAQNFEKQIGYALDARVTPDIAYRELTGFLEGKPSRYAKSPKKTPPVSSSERPEGLGADLTDAERSRYREFARLIAGFFASNVEVKTILELCRENDELKEQGSDLVDGEYLDQAIQAAVKNFKPNGLSSDMVDQIQKFANTFAKMKELNK